MSRRHIVGFSLIEVLVAVLVLALGVIGAAGMQLTALRTSHQSGLQTMAVQLAAELADKMRANDRQMKTNDADNPFIGINFRQSVEGSPTAPSKLCYSATCDSRELADFDIYEWKKRLAATLPEARAVVCRDAQPWDDAQHSLAWECQGGTGAGASVVIKVGWQAKNPDGTVIRNASKEFPPAVAFTVEPYIQ